MPSSRTLWTSWRPRAPNARCAWWQRTCTGWTGRACWRSRLWCGGCRSRRRWSSRQPVRPRCRAMRPGCSMSFAAEGAHPHAPIAHGRADSKACFPRAGRLARSGVGGDAGQGRRKPLVGVGAAFLLRPLAAAGMLHREGQVVEARAPAGRHGGRRRRRSGWFHGRRLAYLHGQRHQRGQAVDAQGRHRHQRRRLVRHRRSDRGHSLDHGSAHRRRSSWSGRRRRRRDPRMLGRCRRSHGCAERRPPARSSGTTRRVTPATPARRSSTAPSTGEPVTPCCLRILIREGPSMRSA